MDIRKWTRRQIRQRIYQSSMRGLVPQDFESDGAVWITFIPTDPFWKAWRVNRNWMQAVGCRVYAYNRYDHRRPIPPDGWRCQLTLDRLDGGTDRD